MKTYKLKDGRKVKAVKDKEDQNYNGCLYCEFVDEPCADVKDKNNLPKCITEDIHFEIVED